MVVWSLGKACVGASRGSTIYPREEPLCGWETVWKKGGRSLEAEISSFLRRCVDRKMLHPGEPEVFWLREAQGP